jgi:hypothetical protein
MHALLLLLLLQWMPLLLCVFLLHSWLLQAQPHL